MWWGGAGAGAGPHAAAAGTQTRRPDDGRAAPAWKDSQSLHHSETEASAAQHKTEGGENEGRETGGAKARFSEQGGGGVCVWCTMCCWCCLSGTALGLPRMSKAWG